LFHGIGSDELASFAYFGLLAITQNCEALTRFGARHLATATSKLLLRHVLWHDVMMFGATRSGIFLNIILLLILVNPLLAAKTPAKKIRQQLAQEERQSEFVKGKSKRRSEQSSRSRARTIAPSSAAY
jgi:hypothetical protein